MVKPPNKQAVGSTLQRSQLLLGVAAFLLCFGFLLAKLMHMTCPPELSDDNNKLLAHLGMALRNITSRVKNTELALLRLDNLQVLRKSETNAQKVDSIVALSVKEA